MKTSSPPRKAFCAIIALILIQKHHPVLIKPPLLQHPSWSLWQHLGSISILLPCLLLWCFNGNLQQAFPAFITTRRTLIGGSIQGPSKKKKELYFGAFQDVCARSQRWNLSGLAAAQHWCLSLSSGTVIDLITQSQARRRTSRVLFYYGLIPV